MQLTPSSLKTLFTGYKTAFQGGLTEAQSLYQKLTTVVPSTTASEEYGWLGQMPGMREWIGERVVHGLETHGYSIKNKPFELTVGVPRTTIEDDTYGVYTPMMGELGRSAAAHPDQLTFGLLALGTTEKCYDGKPFFSANHPVKKVDGKNENVSNVDASGNGPWWYVLDTSRSIKPLIFQDRKKPNFVAMTAETDPNVFTKAELVYGVDARCNVGFGFWQMAYASNKPMTADNVWAAIDAIEGCKGDAGRPLALKATTLVVPTQLQRQANKLMTAELVPVTVGGDTTTESNDLKDRLEVIVSGWMS
ncbi:Mu-like prophage major head subunit gpT family protein [Comamonas sp.]|uniref:Mu-like prophage major head subunit gpT family protein n=1 Tax=Comamonas sp. TaxID=34028 RepID=UPI00259049FD|nr:Mu-like prophage major head subunit gpT family protein [Comamonas sp.]